MKQDLDERRVYDPRTFPATTDGPQPQPGLSYRYWPRATETRQTPAQWLADSIRGIRDLINVLPADMQQGLLDRLERLDIGVRELLMERTNH